MVLLPNLQARSTFFLINSNGLQRSNEAGNEWKKNAPQRRKVCKEMRVNLDVDRV
jgi:hypothetical protein